MTILFCVYIFSICKKIHLNHLSNSVYSWDADNHTIMVIFIDGRLVYDGLPVEETQKSPSSTMRNGLNWFYIITPTTPSVIICFLRYITSLIDYANLINDDNNKRTVCHVRSLLLYFCVYLMFWRVKSSSYSYPILSMQNYPLSSTNF